MQQIGDWLENLGMSEYSQCFTENKIDLPVLPYVSDQDLKDLGIPLGHRRKILGAIGELTAKPTPPCAGEIGERRHLTVMFSDLVGSTELSCRMDPEDLRDIISAYQKCVVDTVHRFDGFVAEFMGDGVLVYFGYPRAHEDNAERAVLAGLGLITATSALNSRGALQVRVGIATGLVVVDGLIGSGGARERSIVGKTPNLAARIQGIAEPNTVVICDGTRRLLGNLFELKDLGPKDLKGIAGQMRAWAVLRASSVVSRFEAFHGTGVTVFVGRDEELAMLLRRWSRAKSGEGQVVLLSGEAGIGKSRLTAVLQEHLVNEPHVCLRFFCSPQHTDSALYPIISQMERYAKLEPDDTTGARLDKLDVMLERTSTSIDDAALFAEMLSLPNDGRYPVLELTAEQRRQRTLDACFAQIQGLTRFGPMLMVYEDAHWTDPTSLAAISRVVEHIETLPVLLILTFRPDFDPPWIGRPYVTALILNRLTKGEVGTMIDHLVGNETLQANLRQDIIERTDGIPLFVEEMTKALMEAGSDSATVAAAVPLTTRSVPASLQSPLMSRLDRLGAAKEIAQTGAAIGRAFSCTLLAAVMRRPGADLESALGRLVEAGLLFRQGVPPHTSYLFKHALVQDAAYGALLRNSRRSLHARIARILESQFADVAERQPELLAHHYTEAGLLEKAAGFWGKAGRRSLDRSALVEAAEQLARALAQIAILPSTAALRREQILLQVALLTPLMHVKGYAAPETKAAAERARLLIEEAEARGENPEDPLLLFSVLFGFWTASFVAFDGDALRERASQFLALAEQRKAAVPIMIGHRIMGSMVHIGAFIEGREHLDRALELYDPIEHRPLATRFGQDMRVAALSHRCWALWMLGYVDAARLDANLALKEAREIGQAFPLMHALAHTLFIHLQCGDYAAANAESDELLALANEKGTLFWKAMGQSVRGCLLAAAGKPADAVQMITSGIAALRLTGSTLGMPAYLSCLAIAYAELGQFENARRIIGDAMQAMEKTKETWREAEIYRIAGEIALLSPAPDLVKAATYFERGLAIARRQQAKMWELRVEMSLARLRRNLGKRGEARDHLASVLDWFTEGFDTLDLRQARILLDSLASDGDRMDDSLVCTTYPGLCF